MYNSKMCDIIFSVASSVNNKDVFRGNNLDIPVIFEDIFCIISSIFENIDLKQLWSTNAKASNSIEKDQKSFKKPIRHGRFSGSVSVQLSVSFVVFQNTVI